MDKARNKKVTLPSCASTFLPCNVYLFTKEQFYYIYP